MRFFGYAIRNKKTQKIRSELLQLFIPNEDTYHKVHQFLSVPPLKIRKSSLRFSSANFNNLLFNPLKIKEKNIGWNKHRIRTDYKDNNSVAISLPASQKDLNKKKNDAPALLKLSENNIMEHASRRVDLFFYTLVAYYNTHYLPVQGHTNIQHGIGRHDPEKNTITQACHSSFFPSLIDKTINHAHHTESDPTSILSGTHFLENLNSTVELPSFVNELDGLLENTYSGRLNSIKIIQDVAQGNINPIEGLNQFLVMMNDIMSKVTKKATTFPFTFKPSLVPALIDLEKRGTLDQEFCVETQTVRDSYLQSLLRCKPEEISNLKNTKKALEKFYLTKIEKLQKEILTTKASSTPPVHTNFHFRKR